MSLPTFAAQSPAPPRGCGAPPMGPVYRTGRGSKAQGEIRCQEKARPNTLPAHRCLSPSPQPSLNHLLSTRETDRETKSFAGPLLL